MSDEGESIDLSGRELGNWRLIRRLGEGGFGAVYEAQHVTIAGRKGALKVLHPHMAFNPEIKRRFINEASAASRAEHENIVQIFDGGVAPDGVCWAVMEFLRGRALTDLIREGAMEPRRAMRIGAQIASALHAAHQLGIVHRDLKPDNVYVVARETNPEFVKVLDFGIAKLMTDEGVATRAGMLMGTPGYMSPEQWQTLPDIDGRSDIYALGVILFELVTGQRPFSGHSMIEWLEAHLKQTPPDPAQLAAVDRPLADLILRMLAKRREERPQTMAEVAAALRALEAGAPAPSPPRASTEMPTVMGAVRPMPTPTPQSPIVTPSVTPTPSVTATPSATPTPSVTPSPSLTPSVVPPVRTGPAAPRSGGRTPLLLVGAGLVVLLGSGAIAWRVTRAGQPPTPPTPSPTPPPTPEPSTPPTPAAPALPAGLIAVPGGSLKMGREAGARAVALDAPPTTVEVQPFAIARTEVTVGEYAAFVEARGVKAPWGALAADELTRRGRLPVTGVTRADAEAYCRWKYPDGGRLPSESEWELAARGAEGRLFPFGDTFKAACVLPPGGGKEPFPVDALPCGATPSGILGLSGNVWEWTSTTARVYPGSKVPSPPPTFSVVRGGSAFNTDPDELTATSRSFVDAPNGLLGFRCAFRAD